MRRLQKALLSLLSTIIVATSIPIVISSCSPYPDFSTDKMVFVDNDEQMMSIEFNQHGGTYEILLRILDNKATTIEITASMSSQGIVSINQGATWNQWTVTAIADGFVSVYFNVFFRNKNNKKVQSTCRLSITVEAV